ncbi:peptidylprolyl isomerase [Metallibacterium sp.]|uniref:peptidylprolyl isomerase n=1 Tax=Metallibacterium sp. TaxID=2940281 RepID=UPI0026373412|nr:peptidylprolyl isomerase [Metallibacterium sp.]
MRCSLLTLIALAALGCAQAAPAPAGMAQILARAPAADWRTLDPAHLLVMRLPQGRVVIELAPRFAPAHMANIETLARAHYWNGLAITRVQDDFVTQWGDPNADTAQRRALPAGLPRTLPAEYERAAAGLDFTRLPDGDVYAPEVGFVHGFPVGENPRTRHAWLLHCYGMVGVGRDNPPDTGNGAELYVVIGQAPRQLDRNIAVVGRVVQGMDLLSALPRGHGPLGFYRDAAHRTRILSMRMVNTLPATRRPRLQALRTDTPTFTALIAARRNRRNPWFVRPAGRIGVCNVPLPVRELPPPAP